VEASEYALPAAGSGELPNIAFFTPISAAEIEEMAHLLEGELHQMGEPRKDFRQRLGYVLGALPGVVLHFLVSVAAWTFIQLSGLVVGGCSESRPCNLTLTYMGLNGIQPVLLVVWALTTILAIIRPLVWGTNPWPVLGIGGGASILITALDYLALAINSGLV
jgi:hypothetical protein